MMAGSLESRFNKKAMSHYVRKSVPAESGGELGDACPKMLVDEVESSKSKAEISWLEFWWTSFIDGSSKTLSASLDDAQAKVSIPPPNILADWYINESSE